MPCLTIFIFDSVLEVVDRALGSAADPTDKTSGEVDDAFKEAMDELESYALNCPCRLNPTVTARMTAAKTNDKAACAFLQSLKARLSPKVRLERIQLLHLMNNVTDNKQPGPTKDVEFCLVKSLPDPPPPIIVKREYRICLQY